MARNLYFSEKVRSEMDLYTDLVIEALKIYGQDLYYLPRELVNEDILLGEDPTSRFPTSHKIEMYIENVEGFDGEGDLFTRFGVQIKDEATFVVARSRFAAQVRRPDNAIQVDRPAEGDLIYLPLANKMFEIQHVEHEQPFYQIENLPVYKMRCSLFEYTGEDFDTGIEDIQDIEKTGSYQYKVCVTGTGNAAVDVTLDSADSAGFNGIQALRLIDAGAYYTSAPVITFTGGEDSSFSPGDSAVATATIDPTTGKVTAVTLVSSGDNYLSSPTVTFTGGNLGVDSDYRIGDTVAMQLPSGTGTISGEIQRIAFDSAGDSNTCMWLAHVGTDDGEYHTFIPGEELINTTRSGIIGRGLIIRNVSEDNKISQTEQNNIFEEITDDFLDFTESNPFGEPK